MNEEKLNKLVKILAGIDFKSFVTKSEMFDFFKELSLLLAQGEPFKQEISTKHEALESDLNSKINSLQESINNKDISELEALKALLGDVESTAVKLASLNLKDGKDGANGTDGQDGIDGVNGKDGVDGKDGNEITVEDIASKINSTKDLINPTSIRGLDKLAKHIDTLKGGDSSNPISLLSGGVLVKSGAAKINFTGATLTQNGDTTTIAITGGGAGVTDGDKGDITVSASGATWTIDNGVVTNAKSADMATKTYKGRTSALTGAPEDVPVATLKTDLVLVKADVGLANADNTSDTNKPISTATQTALDAKVAGNVAITGATKTKITYDAKGLVTAGADATTADIAPSTNRNYVTDAQQTVITNTSGTNSGDNATNTQYSGLAASKENAITGTTSADFWSGAKTFVNFATTVRATVLTGLSLVSTTVIAATDTVLVAIGSLQAQITALTTTVGTKVASVTAGTNVTVTGTATNPIINASGGGTTINMGALVYADGSVPAGNTVANTVTETALTSSYTIPANTLAVGNVVRLRVAGLYSTDVVAPNVTAKIKIGSVVVATTGSITAVAAVTNGGYTGFLDLIVTNAGASGVVESQGFLEFATAATTALTVNLKNTAAVSAIDFTANQTITVTIQWSAASASNTLTMRQMELDINKIVASSGGLITRLVSSIAVNTTGGAAANTDYVYVATAGLVFTLPTAVGNTNQYTLKATTTGVSFATTSSQTVDGSTTGTLITNQSLTFYSDGANWQIN